MYLGANFVHPLYEQIFIKVLIPLHVSLLHQNLWFAMIFGDVFRLRESTFGTAYISRRIYTIDKSLTTQNLMVLSCLCTFQFSWFSSHKVSLK